MKRIAIILYFAILAADLAGVYFDSVTRWMTKPLLMSVLLIYYLLNSKGKQPLMMFALSTALLGDMFLQVPLEGLFVIGMLAFAITHLCYIGLFRKQSTESLSTLQLIGIGLLGLAGVGAIFQLIPLVGELQIPLGVYIAILIVMSAFAILRKQSLNGYGMVVTGAILFLISDYLIGYNRFVSNIDLAGIYIMLTYGVAQFLIVHGYMQSETTISPLLRKPQGSPR